VEDDVGEGKGEEQFCDEDLPDVRRRARLAAPDDGDREEAADCSGVTCVRVYRIQSAMDSFPRIRTARLTAGLRCPPEMGPVANTITIRIDPIANGASAPAPVFGSMAVKTVKTRKKVPMNSARSRGPSGWLGRWSDPLVGTGVDSAVGGVGVDWRLDDMFGSLTFWWPRS
jgi:hypothetical protein